MPLPERMRAPEVSLKKISELAKKAEGILAKIEQGSADDDPALVAMINEWNSQTVSPRHFADFRDFPSSTSAIDFTRTAMNQARLYPDFTWAELIQTVNFICDCEGAESEQDYALSLLECNFDANASDLIFWPDSWFDNPELADDELSAEEIAGYLLARSGRHLPDAPALTLMYPIPGHKR